jgi:hypothetical protein
LLFEIVLSSSVATFLLLMYFIYHARSRRRIKEQQQRNAATKTATTDACDERTKSPSEADMFRERELERGEDLIGFMCNARDKRKQKKQLF